MGLVFEELIRKFAELSNETEGEHFTPREVIRLTVDLIFIEDSEALTEPGVVRTNYNPAAGTGGMLSIADEHLTTMNPKARLTMYGEELKTLRHEHRTHSRSEQRFQFGLFRRRARPTAIRA
jgi:type I restriction enzyme M protein